MGVIRGNEVSGKGKYVSINTNDATTDNIKNKMTQLKTGYKKQ